jgi:hypothetical protein
MNFSINFEEMNFNKSFDEANKKKINTIINYLDAIDKTEGKENKAVLIKLMYCYLNSDCQSLIQNQIKFKETLIKKSYEFMRDLANYPEAVNSIKLLLENLGVAQIKNETVVKPIADNTQSLNKLNRIWKLSLSSNEEIKAEFTSFIIDKKFDISITGVSADQKKVWVEIEVNGVFNKVFGKTEHLDFWIVLLMKKFLFTQ